MMSVDGKSLYFCFQYPVERSAVKQSKTEESSKKKPKTNVPKSFIVKIKSLGLKEEDAEVLYETKIDWTAVYSDNKIYCTEGGEQKCDFVTEMKIDNVDLRNHLRTVHNWGDWPCTDSNCGYIAHSKVRWGPTFGLLFRGDGHVAHNIGICISCGIAYVTSHMQVVSLLVHPNFSSKLVITWLQLLEFRFFST